VHSILHKHKLTKGDLFYRVIPVLWHENNILVLWHEINEHSRKVPVRHILDQQGTIARMKPYYRNQFKVLQKENMSMQQNNSSVSSEPGSLYLS
jgi:hypothetical protein